MEDPEVTWEISEKEYMMHCTQLSLQEERAAWRNGCVDKCDKQRNSWKWIFGNHGILPGEIKECWH